MSFAEYCALNKIVPSTLWQAEQIERRLEKFAREHPELHGDIARIHIAERARVERSFDFFMDGVVKFRKR